MFRDQKNYTRNDKAQDYHDMIGKTFKEMNNIMIVVVFNLILDFGTNKKHDVIAIPVIQFIICDCKANDLLYGRKCDHSLNIRLMSYL